LACLLAVCAGVTGRISISDIPVQNPSEAVHEGLPEADEAAAPSDSSSSSCSVTAESRNRESSSRSHESRLQPHVVVEAVADNAVQADDTEGAETSGTPLKVTPRAPWQWAAALHLQSTFQSGHLAKQPTCNLN